MCSIAAFLLLLAAPFLLMAGASDGAPSGSPPEILQDSRQRLERLFGPAARMRPGAGRQERQLLFDPSPWRRLWPDLPEDAAFGISLGPEGKVRAVWLDVNAMVREARTGVSEEFHFGKTEAFAFFRRIFNRNPTRWEAMRLPQGGGGHEGFRDRRICVDPGVALTFITYRLGEEWIRLVADPRCR